MIRRSFLRTATSIAAAGLALVSCAASACSGRLHVEIADAGVYALDRASVIAAQPLLGDCRVDDLYLLNRGKEVAIHTTGDESGMFGPHTRIEWLGQALHGPESWYDQYSSVNVYQLGAKPGAHQRMREAASNASNAVPLQRSLHFEQENFMLRVSDAEMKPGEEPDVWQWAKLTPIDAKPFTYDFDLPDIDARSAHTDAQFVVAFRGMSNTLAKKGEEKPVDHLVEISVNGNALAKITWDGRSEFRNTIAVPLRMLRDKGNSVEIRVPRRDLPHDPTNFIVDVVMFNWFEVSYPIHHRIGETGLSFGAAHDGSATIETTGETDVFGADATHQRVAAPASDISLKRDVTYFAASAEHLRKPALIRAIAEPGADDDGDGYDYLIVAHPRLLDAIQPLAQYHREHGLKVRVYNIDDVYDRFGAGIVHPRAIRDLVVFATQHWTIKPRYLLLVGDASFDIHHDQRVNSSKASQYAIRTGLQRDELLAPGGLSAMDTTRYAKWDDQLPNRNLIPTWQFPTAEGQSASDNRFVATDDDDFHPRLSVGRLPVVEPDEVKAIVDKTIAYLKSPPPGDWRRDVTLVSTSEVPSFKGESDKIAKSLGQRGFAVNNVYTDFNEKDAHRYQAVRSTLRQDLNPGNLLVHFIGHGGQFIWRVGPIGDLFTLDDVSALTNLGRYPMVLAMTCFSAPFDHPTEDSIGERFLRETDKGAVAVFAASWSNWPNPENSSKLIDALLTPGVRIGDAIMSVKAKTADRTLVEMYNLLGDPAIVLAQPNGRIDFARDQNRWRRQVIARVDLPSFAGNVDVDWLSASGDVVQSRHYEARDAQFALPIPPNAATLRLYAEDLRNGHTAFGGFDLNATVAKTEAPKKPEPPVTVVAKPKARRVAAPDTVRYSDFESSDDARPSQPSRPADEPPQKH